MIRRRQPPRVGCSDGKLSSPREWVADSLAAAQENIAGMISAQIRDMCSLCIAYLNLALWIKDVKRGPITKERSARAQMELYILAELLFCCCNAFI